MSPPFDEWARRAGSTAALLAFVSILIIAFGAILHVVFIVVVAILIMVLAAIVAVVIAIPLGKLSLVGRREQSVRA